MYNKNGYLTTKYAGLDTTKYTYDNLGNLLLVNLPNGSSIEYVVDANNRRIAKKVDGILDTRYLYQDQLKPAAELDSAGNVKRRYVYGLKQNVPDYYEQGGSRYKIVTDHLGSVRMVIKESTGEVVTKIEYDEYGNENVAVRDTSLSSMFFGYAGGISDTETGLVRFGARDYNSVTGRWTAKDPILFSGGDLNLFGYVFTDPVNLCDDNGKMANWQFAAIVSATVSASEAALRGNSIGDVMISGLIGGGTGAIGGLGSKLGSQLAWSFLGAAASNAINQYMENDGEVNWYSVAGAGLSASALVGLNYRSMGKVLGNKFKLSQQVDLASLFNDFESTGALITSLGASAFDLTMRAIQSVLNYDHEKR